MQAPPTTVVLLSTGERLEVAGAAEDIGRMLHDAARSSPGTLAWLPDADGGEAIGVNPTHVVTVTAAR